MSSVLITLLALAAPPVEGDQGPAPAPAVVSAEKAASAEQAPVAPRMGPELRDAVRAALRRWAKVSDKEADAAAREFLTLYQELQSDDQLSRTQREYFAQKVRIRLMRLSDQITLRVARERRLAKVREAEKGTEAPDAKADSMETSQGAGGRQDDSLSLLPPAEPARGGAAMQMPDHGELLVELIQTVIRPETWDINGGTGTIYYWYPGRALVVRQMDEVHEEIADVLGQLRRAGR